MDDFTQPLLLQVGSLRTLVFLLSSSDAHVLQAKPGPAQSASVSFASQPTAASKAALMWAKVRGRARQIDL